MHARRGSVQTCVLAGMLLLPGAALASSCTFSDLQWSADGTHLRFLAGDAPDVRTLQVDVAGGTIECLDPRVREPLWADAPGRVLFRDLFGVFELVPGSGRPPRLRLFLPEASRTFLRAFGVDARGQFLFWTYDLDRGEHELWTQSSPPERLTGLQGPEALRRWDERNRARPFDAAGGLFVRSSCVRQPNTQSRLCLEKVVVGGSEKSPLFRVTLGPPGGVDVLQERCAPSACVTSADSTSVVMGLFEDLDDAGRSEVLSVWECNWHEARRVVETSLPQPVDTRGRHAGWARWLAGGGLLWADTVGQLFQLPPRFGAPVALVALAAPTPTPVHVVVAGSGADRAALERLREQLRAAGFEAGIAETAAGFEVQTGAEVDAAAAARRVEQLRRGGFAPAHVREGAVESVAAEVSFAAVAGPAGRIAYVRHRQTARGLFAEIWIAAGAEKPRLLVPAFADAEPVLAPAD
jgi:sporulation related protein